MPEWGRRHALQAQGLLCHNQEVPATMPGKILIVDDTATNRIVLKVKLAASFYQTIQARTGAEAMACLDVGAVDLVVLGPSLPDMSVETLIRTIRARCDGVDLPLLLVAAAHDRDIRIAAFEAGLDDCLERPVPDALLLARVRSLLRIRDESAGLSLPVEGAGLGGMAEPAASYLPPGRVALVAERPETALRWRASLVPHLADQITICTREEALAGDTRPEADLYIIAADLGPGGSGLQLMSDLRSRSATRGAAICVVVPPGQTDLAVAALDLGANGLLPQGFDAAEAAARARAMIRRKQAGDAHRAALRHGLQMALTDPLTGLRNRRFALPALGRLRSDAVQNHAAVAVMIIDVDRFKSVNDRFGHAAGDAVLVEIAHRLAAQAGPADLLARIGGEEFLLGGIAICAADAKAFADRLCRAIDRKPIALPNDGGSIRVTVSIGLAVVLPQDGMSEPVDQILHRADCAMLVAKGGGRNQVTVSRTAA